MKIKGKSISAPNISVLVIPRENGDDIVFKAQAVLDMDVFEKLCPEPKPPNIRHRERGLEPDYKDAKYLKAQETHAEQRMAYMVIESLKATEDLEWESVDFNDPNTWCHYKDELKASGFNHIEIGRITNLVFEANSLNESKYKEARDRFTLSQVQAPELSSQKEEQLTTVSGELAKD